MGLKKWLAASYMADYKVVIIREKAFTHFI
jgi:hypothetical protein